MIKRQKRGERYSINTLTKKEISKNASFRVEDTFDDIINTDFISQ